ncbi:hypothetical protein LCGC14_2618640, partial [marine sediment metagenome]
MSYSLSLRELAELEEQTKTPHSSCIGHCQACGVPSEYRRAMPFLLTLINDLGEKLEKIQRAKMAHHSGGDSAMIFDSYDGEVEQE